MLIVRCTLECSLLYKINDVTTSLPKNSQTKLICSLTGEGKERAGIWGWESEINLLKVRVCRQGRNWILIWVYCFTLRAPALSILDSSFLGLLMGLFNGFSWKLSQFEKTSWNCWRQTLITVQLSVTMTQEHWSTLYINMHGQFFSDLSWSEKLE